MADLYGVRTRVYGARHRRIRREWATRVATGTVACARCGKVIEAGSPWDLGHHDLRPEFYAGPEHQACNRATSSRLRPRYSRVW